MRISSEAFARTTEEEFFFPITVDKLVRSKPGVVVTLSANVKNAEPSVEVRFLLS